MFYKATDIYEENINKQNKTNKFTEHNTSKHYTQTSVCHIYRTKWCHVPSGINHCSIQATNNSMLCFYLHAKRLTSVFYRRKMSLKRWSQARFLKCIKTLRLRLKLVAQKPQAKFLTSECTNWWRFNSCAEQKHFGHSLQTYGFTPCRCTCTLKSPLRLNFFWQTSQVSQVPSLCDSSRCRFSWLNHIKRSEQCLHECGFAPVWTRTWLRTS